LEWFRYDAKRDTWTSVFPRMLRSDQHALNRKSHHGYL
jgi:hypothetical protein